MPESLLIVDDEKNTRDGLRGALEDSFEVYVAADIAGALATIEDAGIDVVVTDLRLGGESGMDLLEKALKLKKPPVCIMMTAYGGVDTAVEAMRRGAYDFVTKPVNIDRLRHSPCPEERGSGGQRTSKSPGTSECTIASRGAPSTMSPLRAMPSQTAPSFTATRRLAVFSGWIRISIRCRPSSANAQVAACRAADTATPPPRASSATQ